MVKHSGEIVKAALKTKGITQAELARKIGRDQTLISRYLSGQIEVSDRAARSIANALDMDFEELHRQLQRDRLKRKMENVAAEFKDVLDEEEKANIGAAILVDSPDIVTVPMLDSVPVRGRGWSAEGSEKYALPPDTQVDVKRSFAVKVNSKNMADDNIDVGDIIVVDSGAVVQDGDIVLAIVRGEPLLRKIYRTGENTVLQASGDHEKPVIVLSQEDDFEVVGSVALYTKFFIS